MVVTRATAPATTADPGVVFGMTANVPQDSAALRESVFVSTGTSPAPLVTLHRYQGFVAVISNQFRGPAFVSEVSERISAQWEANQYVVPGGDAQGKYFEFSIVPDALAKKTFAEWQGISSNGVGRDLDSKLTFVPPTDPQVVGQKLSLTNLRGVVFVSLAEAAPSVTLDLRPYLRVGEKFTLIDANQRGALVVPETLFDGRPLKVTLPSAAPVPLAGVPLAPAAMRPTSAPTFYAFQVRTP
jgi:hypothetical protein